MATESPALRINAPGYLFLALLFAATVAAGAQSHEHSVSDAPAAPSTAPAGPIQQLSPELRGLFREEMVALQGAMLELVPAHRLRRLGVDRTPRRAHARGLRARAEAHRSPSEELVRRLPEAFLERDGEFHELAAGLADAAHESRAPVVVCYSHKLTESCVGCHARYAAHRFPGYAKPPETTLAHPH